MKINVCSLQDPTSPKSWSGSPNRIVNELERNGQLGACLTSGALPPRLRMLCQYLSLGYYRQREDLERGILFRYARSYRVGRRTRSREPSHTLHLGTLDLPFVIPPKHDRHYLFCDCTWNTSQQYSTVIGGCKGKLLEDAERLERKSYHQMSHIFPTSEYVKTNLIDHYDVDPSSVTVVGSGRGEIAPYYGEKDYGNGRILFVAKGRFEDKGGNIVVEAFRLARKSQPNLQLTIVGQESYKKRLPSMSGVTVHGFIPLEDLQELFNTHSLFLMPAISEPWGLVYLEALSCRMPIVGLNRNSLPELSQHGRYGFCVEEANPEKLSSVILEAFDDPLQLEVMGSEGQEYCLSHFSWEETVQRITRVILSGERTNR